MTDNIKTDWKIKLLLEQETGQINMPKYILQALHVLSMADLEEKMLETLEKKMIWQRYIDDIFFIWEHDEKALKFFRSS